MTIQLVSSSSTKKDSRPKIVKYLPLREVVCMTGHWRALDESVAILINLRKKLTEKAVFQSTNPDKDVRCTFIQSVYVGIKSTDGIFTESALIGKGFPQIKLDEEYGIYLRYFVREQFVKFFAQTVACAGIRILFYKDGKV